MLIVTDLRNVPNVALRVRLRCQFELRLGDEINDFVGGQELPRVEVDAALAPPDDDLPDGEASYDVMAILQ